MSHAYLFILFQSLSYEDLLDGRDMLMCALPDVSWSNRDRVLSFAIPLTERILLWKQASSEQVLLLSVFVLTAFSECFSSCFMY